MTQIARPTSSFSVGTNYTLTGAATRHEALSDQSDSSWLDHAASQNRNNYGEFANLTDPVSSSGHVLWARREGVSGTGSCALELWQGDPNGGGSLITTMVLDETTIGNQSLALSGAQADSITNYADLWWQLETSGTHTSVIYEVWFEIPDTTVVLVVADATHAHAGDNLVLVQNVDLAIADALHGHAAENLGLTQHHVLVLQDALHAHLADNVVIVQHHILTVAEALHAHEADFIRFIHHLEIAGALHGLTNSEIDHLKRLTARIVFEYSDRPGISPLSWR